MPHGPSEAAPLGRTRPGGVNPGLLAAMPPEGLCAFQKNQQRQQVGKRTHDVSPLGGHRRLPRGLTFQRQQSGNSPGAVLELARRQCPASVFVQPEARRNDY